MDELPSMDPFSHDLDTPQLAEAEIRDDINISSSIPLAPPVTFNKFLTMQVRSYSGMNHAMHFRHTCISHGLTYLPC